MKRGYIWIVIPLLLTACAKRGPTMPGQLKPGSAEYILNEGVFYLNQGQIDQARAKIQESLKKKPNSKAAHYSMGVVYTYLRDFPAAIKHFKTVLNLDPEYWDAYNSLGLVYTETGEFDLARQYLLKAATSDKYRNPENAYVNLAMLEIKRDSYDNALRYIDKGIEENRNFAPLHNLRGIVLEKQGNLEDALYHYKKALSFLTEEDANILVNVARTHHLLGQKKKAMDLLDQALGLAKDEFTIQRIRALIREVEGKQEKKNADQ
ncbi:MAG: tetratricopeptide repeat protein [Acidobacteriota bacterium]|jgi:Tfp pilus assembly protein PilF|nr:tetratricopeptide repeat protein [Acidobacteriota bacterium]